MKLTENFTLEELCATSTGLPNDPPTEAMSKLFYLAAFILQPIRDKFGAITITSGYRSPVVNKSIGGAASSQHMLGEAADFVPDEPLEYVFRYAVNTFLYGQCILEDAGGKRWIHISLPRINGINQQALLMNEGVYRPWS